VATSTDGPATTPDSGTTEPWDQPYNGILDTSGPVDVLTLWGSRHDIGYAEGALLCDRITNLVEDYVLDFWIADSGMDWDTLSAFAIDPIDVSGGDRDELEGLLQGMQDHCPADALIVQSDYLGLGDDGSRALTLDDLILANALPDLGCSSFTVWGEASASQSTLHGRNFDYTSDPKNTFLTEHLIKVIRSDDEDTDFVSVSMPGLMGCISCFSDDGVGLTMHNVTGLSTEHLGGFVPRTWAMRAALVAAANGPDPIGAAESVMDGSPQFRGNNLHLSLPCDGDGCTGGAVYELDGHTSHGDGQATVRLPHHDLIGAGSAIVATNHYVERSTPPTSGDSYSRYDDLSDHIQQAIGDGGVDVSTAWSMLSDVSLSNTAHSLVVHDRILHLRVSRDRSTRATDVPAISLGFDDLFAAVPTH